MWKLYLILILVLAGWGVETTSSEAACTGASPAWTTTPDRDSVQTCVSGVSTGDTVYVSDGTATWTTRVNFPAVAFTFITQTAPTVDANDIPTACAVTITDGTDYTNSSTRRLIAWSTASSGLHRISGFCFDGNAAGANDANNVGHLAITGTTSSLRLDHNIFTAERSAMMFLRGYLRGVVDHNLFYLHDFKFGIYVFHDNWDNNANGCAGTVSNGCGDSSWASPSTMGTSDTLYIEDNHFWDNDGGVLTYAIDGWAGSRVAIRFNTFTNTVTDQHGTESAGRSRGVRHTEYYRNDSSFTVASTDMAGLRGGTGIVFHNDGTTGVGGSMTRGISLSNFRSGCPNGTSDCSHIFWRCAVTTLGAGNLTSSGTTATVSYGATPYIRSNESFIKIEGANEANYNGTFKITGVVGSTFTYTMPGSASSPATGTITVSSPWDQNDESNGYLCLDQPGAGRGDLIGSGLASLPAEWPNQASEPFYIWGNTKNGSSIHTGGYPSVVVADRDLYVDAVSFDGTSGVGEGERGSRPGTCTSGVAYWSTDGGSNWNTSTTETHSSSPGLDGGLDLCVASAWVNDWYVPYTYPHPLQNAGADPDPDPPSTFTVGSTTAGAYSILIWSPVDETDADFGGYRVYCGSSPGVYDSEPKYATTPSLARSQHTSSTRALITFPTAGTYYCAGTVYDLAGVNSDYSSEVTVVSPGSTR